MGPRPPRRGAAALTGVPRPPRQTVPAPRPVAPVGAPSSRRAPPIDAVPLPAETRRTLSGIIKTMRDVPRAIIGDPAEVVHFLGRTARALERLRDEPVPVTPTPARPAAPLTAPGPAPRALSARERAEAAFRPTPSPAAGPTSSPFPIALPAPRTVTDRRGRGVRVEVRRARAAGQLEMPV